VAVSFIGGGKKILSKGKAANLKIGKGVSKSVYFFANGLTLKLPNAWTYISGIKLKS
jgi:hypothetical protein